MTLRDFTSADVKAEIVRYAQKNKFPPTVADITGSLKPEREIDEGKHLPQAEKDAVAALLAGLAPECRILAEHGAEERVGVVLREHVPSGCGACAAKNRCGDFSSITSEHARCRLLKERTGEGTQAELLNKYWPQYCQRCLIPCPWRWLMNGDEPL